ncbi:multidrug transporter [Cohnella endophytica]|uniref:Multidrug transporter n=1 Tax=Cohnella endophytica TaxID=2419778 RepID=A0A494XVU9_9BACL|nr:Flp1 family type IVb pilin [Cohnella endophytica]RKP53814.1 multidrug transporter [Cohnella endophytica]
MIGYVLKNGVKALGALWRDEEGLGTLELVLIAAVLIIVAIFFKDWILEFIGNLMDSIEGKSDSLFKD